MLPLSLTRVTFCVSPALGQVGNGNLQKIVPADGVVSLGRALIFRRRVGSRGEVVGSVFYGRINGMQDWDGQRLSAVPAHFGGIEEAPGITASHYRESRQAQP